MALTCCWLLRSLILVVLDDRHERSSSSFSGARFMTGAWWPWSPLILRILSLSMWARLFGARFSLFLYYRFLGYIVNLIRLSRISKSLLVDFPSSHLCFTLSPVLFEEYCCRFFLSIIMRAAFSLQHCISEPLFCSTKC